MKVGSLVYATDQGLGILAKSFYDAGIVTDALVIRHGRRPEHDEWYPSCGRISDLRAGRHVIREFCKAMDVMLFFETPFDWNLIQFCREIGTKTALMPMHECHPKDQMPGTGAAPPDLYLCPSLIEWQHFHPSKFISGQTRSAFLPVPVSVPWRKRERAEVFIHNAGWGGLRGRNGTLELLKSWRYVRSQAKLIIRSQEQLELTRDERLSNGGNAIFLVNSTVLYNQLWDEGDVFIMPEKFNGLSLPLQEARAAGMLVMCGDRWPMNDWLPNNERAAANGGHIPYQKLNPLIPVSCYVRSCVSGRCLNFDEAVFEPKAIAVKIDEWYGQDISTYSELGKVWAQEMSWEVLGPKYREVLESLL